MKIKRITAHEVIVPAHQGAIDSPGMNKPLHKLPIGVKSGWSVQFDQVPKLIIKLELDNMIGYALVAGTDTPQESDITHAKTVLTRLEASVAKTPNVQYLDTIGCIHFTIGDYEKSLEAFRACLKNLKESSLKDHEKKELFQLVSKRVKAAEEKSKSLPLEWKTES